MARIYKVTRRILFAEGFAYCESRDRPIANRHWQLGVNAGVAASELLSSTEASVQQ